MSPTLLLVIYCLAILLASLAGGWVPIFIKLTHRRMQLAISLVAGFILGIGLLHMLPHAVMAYGADSEHDIVAVAVWMLGGFLVMFFLERFFAFHHHDAPDAPPSADTHTHDHDHARHDHSHAGAADPPPPDLSWSGAAVGLTLHSLIDGVALAAGVKAESLVPGHGAWPGLAVFLVILFHKPFDSLTLGTLVARSGWPASRRHLINALFALAVPVGIALFFLGLQGLGDHSPSTVVGGVLAFSVGVFLCIAMSDLLPELQFHHHDRMALSASLLAGLAIAAAVFFLESGTHQHPDHHAPDAAKHAEISHP